MERFGHQEQTAHQLRLCSEPFVSWQVAGARGDKARVSCPSGRHTRVHIFYN